MIHNIKKIFKLLIPTFIITVSLAAVPAQPAHACGFFGLFCSSTPAPTTATGATGSTPANGAASGGATSDPCHGGITFFPRWYDGLCNPSDGSLKSPADPSLGSDTGHQFATWASIIAMNLVRMLLYVVGYASLIFIIVGGFKYMTNGDNSSGTESAKKTIQNAIIGLVISILSVSIVTFVASRISG